MQQPHVLHSGIKDIFTYFQREIEVDSLTLLSWGTKKKKTENNEIDNHIFAPNLTDFTALKVSGF